VGAVAIAVIAPTMTSADAAVIASGTTTITTPTATIKALAKKGVSISVLKPATVKKTAAGTVVTLPVVAGTDADVSQLVGTIVNGGAFEFENCKTHKEFVVKNITLDLTNFVVTAQVGRSKNGPTALTELALIDFSADPTGGSVTGDLPLTVDGAAALNKALGATVLAAGDNLGTLVSTVTYAP
jgi:hypothetical protein